MNARSLGPIRHVAANDLRLMRRDRGSLFWSFFGPLLFITFFGLLFGGSSGPQRTVVYLRNEDRSDLIATALATALGDDSLIVKRETPPAKGEHFELVVPAGASDSLAKGLMPHLVLRSPDEEPSPREQMLSAEILRGKMSLFMGLEAADVNANLDAAAIRTRIAIQPALRFVKQTVVVAPQTIGFQRTVPAYLIMFLFMSLLTYGAAILIAERKTGQLRRVLVSTVTPGEVVLGKFASRFSWSWLQIAVMIGAGIAIYRIRFGAHPEALLAVLTAFALCATGLGLLFASLFQNPDKAGGLGSLITMSMAALGGCWWPLEIVPKWMAKIAFLLPTGWGFDALNRVMAMDAGLPQVGTHIAVLLGGAAICLPLAARRLRRQD